MYSIALISAVVFLLDFLILYLKPQIYNKYQILHIILLIALLLIIITTVTGIIASLILYFKTRKQNKRNQQSQVVTQKTTTQNVMPQQAAPSTISDHQVIEGSLNPAIKFDVYEGQNDMIIHVEKRVKIFDQNF